MIRRRYEEEEESSDRWLVSYADFITLLFAFFVVMYSVSSVNQGKYQELSSSINAAFTNKEVSQNGNPSLPAEGALKSEPEPIIPKEAIDPITEQPLIPMSEAKIQALQLEREAMTGLGVNLSRNLAPQISDGKIRVTQNNRGLRIDINDNVLFASGSAELEETAKEVLSEIAALLLANNHAIQVEGHTDNTPIHNALFFSNWELSAVRASSVVRMFSNLNIADTRLSALGFGSTQPIGENKTPEGRAKNRHISIMILYDSLNVADSEDIIIVPDQE